MTARVSDPSSSRDIFVRDLETSSPAGVSAPIALARAGAKPRVKPARMKSRPIEDRIKEEMIAVMNARGLSFGMFADEVGVHKQTIYSNLTKNKLGVDQLTEIAELLGLEFEVSLKPAGARPSQLIELAEAARKLDPERRALLADLAENMGPVPLNILDATVQNFKVWAK